MLKITLKIDGMACGMCEAHVNNAIRGAFAVKKVSSSHARKECVIIAGDMPDTKKLGEVIASAGYTLLAWHSEPYENRGFFAKLMGK